MSVEAELKTNAPIDKPFNTQWLNLSATDLLDRTCNRTAAGRAAIFAYIIRIASAGIAYISQTLLAR